MPARVNAGKRFEQDFQNSVPAGIYCYRLKDAGGWSKDQATRFTPSNDYDFILYRRPSLFALELKSVAGGRWPFSLRPKQREGLLRAAEAGVHAGVLLNFRKEARTLWLPIDELIDAERMLLAVGRKSINFAGACDLARFELRGEKKISRHVYDVAGFIGDVDGG